MEKLNETAIKNFREYLQIPSVHPNVDYGDCVKFLTKLAKDINLPIKVIYVKPNKPVVVISWYGKNPELKSILLNSHMDVVPVFEEKWTFKPFGAEIHEGKIYGRGAQDMKSVGIQYLEAIRRLKLKGITCLRNIHVSFVPDEETGGVEGMELFVQTKEFKELNVGASLDEGCANLNENFFVFNGEKTCFQFTITCKGKSGHGLMLLENTAGEKITFLLNKFYELRREQIKLMENKSLVKSGKVLSINCTQINGGVQKNVIPDEITATFDCRVPPSLSVKKFEETIQNWCKEVGDCTINYLQKDEQVPETKLENNKFWNAFKDAIAIFGEDVQVETAPGATDSRFLRKVGVWALAFSPMNKTQFLLHDHDEHLGIDTYLRGIEIYCEVIKSIANVNN